MSAAIAQIDANIGRVHARLKAIHWSGQERVAWLACTEAVGRGDRQESRAHEAWAELCSLMAQAWKQEAER